MTDTAKQKWRVVYGNDTGPDDEGFWEWWDVTADGQATFKSYDEADAEWLCELLNRENP